MFRLTSGRLLSLALASALAVAPMAPALAAGSEQGLERGLLYLQMDLPELALRELERVGDAGGAVAAEALVLEGLVLEAIGRPERAKAPLEAAAKGLRPGPGALGPGVVKTFLGLSAAAQGQVTEAVALYRGALADDPGLGLARVRLAEALGLEGKTSEAIREYQVFLEGNPEDAEALAGVGKLYLANGQRAEAEKALEEALRLDPGVPGAAEALRQVREAVQK